MTVQVTFDDDAPVTGQPNEGQLPKTYPAVPGTPGHAEVTPEPVGSGPVVGGDFTVPLIVTPGAESVEPGGTLTVDGSGLAVSSTGTLALVAGPPGSTGGTVLVETAVTADATGAIPTTTLDIPADATEGEYHLVLSGGAVVIDNVPVTVGAAPVEPVFTATPATVDSSGDEAARTVTASGENFPVSLAGRVSIMTGAPGSGGTEVVGADVTTDATGVLPSTPLIVPSGQAAGDYHVHAEFAGVVVDDVPLTVTAPAPTPTVVPGSTTVEAGSDLVVAGTGFPATTAGRVSLFDGATEIAGSDVTTDAAGEFAGATITVPPGTAAGEYQLRGVVGAATSADVAITVTADPAPEPPTGLVLADIGPASMSATWDAVPGAASYVVYYKPTAETAWMVAGEVTAPTVTATVTSLTAETSYDVAVATVVGGFVSDRSAPETAVTIAGGAALAQAVATAGTPTATSVPLTWDAVADAQSYQIRWRASADADWSPTYGTEDGAATGTSMEGLTAGTEYTFGVRAIGDGTTNTSGPWSADVTATTAAALAESATAKKRTTRKK